MAIKRLTLRNLLSFGPEADPIHLLPLNVLIGPNGSGKSNILAALSLLQAAPGKLAVPTRGVGGGVSEWVWKGATGQIAELEVVLDYRYNRLPLRHRIAFGETSARFELRDEFIEDERPRDPQKNQPYFYYKYHGGSPLINVEKPNIAQSEIEDDQDEFRDNGDEKYGLKRLPPDQVRTDESIISQRKIPNCIRRLLTWLPSMRVLESIMIGDLERRVLFERHKRQICQESSWQKTTQTLLSFSII